MLLWLTATDLHGGSSRSLVRCLHSFLSIFSQFSTSFFSRKPSSRRSPCPAVALPSCIVGMVQTCLSPLPVIERAVASYIEQSCTLSDSRDPTLLHHRTLLSAVGRSFLWLPKKTTAREHSTRSTSASTSSLTGANTSSCSCSRGQLSSSSSSLEPWSTSPKPFLFEFFSRQAFPSSLRQSLACWFVRLPRVRPERCCAPKRSQSCSLQNGPSCCSTLRSAIISSQSEIIKSFERPSNTARLLMSPHVEVLMLTLCFRKLVHASACPVLRAPCEPTKDSLVLLVTSTLLHPR